MARIPRAVARLGVAHSHALRAQLRETWRAGNPKSDTCKFTAFLSEAVEAWDTFVPLASVPAVRSSRNPADAILRLASEQVGLLLELGDIDSVTAVALSEQLDKLAEVQGAVERLATVLLPFPYTLLVHRAVVFYILTSPFAIWLEHWDGIRFCSTLLSPTLSLVSTKSHANWSNHLGTGCSACQCPHYAAQSKFLLQKC